MNSEKKFERTVQVSKYVKEEIKKGNFPTYKELKKKFNLPHYKITLKDIYSRSGVSFLEFPFRRPPKCKQEIRNELLNYVRGEVKNGHYPSHRYIQKRFKLRLVPKLFDSIKDLYKKAGVTYVQKNSQELKNKKARILTEIVVSILSKLNLKLLKSRGIYQQGIDIIAKDKNNKIVGIEVKANNKYEPIKERNILQLKRFLEREDLDKIILITTTSKFESNLSKINDLEMIDYNKLKKLCNKLQLKKLQFIRNKSVHQETKERNIKKQLIINYARKKLKQGKDISYTDISRDLHLHLFTYFNSLNDIYNEAGFLPPFSKIRGCKRNKTNKYLKIAINKILDYIKEEVANGHYPSGEDIQKKFGIGHIWHFVTMKKLYNKLNLPVYHKRKHRILNKRNFLS